MSKKIVIVHGREGSPEHGWLAWLKEELQLLGHEVDALSMPNPSLPRIREWVTALQDQIITNENTFIIAHSIGVQAVLRRAAGLAENVKLGGLVCVAGWFHLTDAAGTKESNDIALPWLQQDVDWSYAAGRFGSIKAIFSDNDPWVPVSDAGLFQELLGAQIRLEHDMKHIYWLDPKLGYPKVLEMLLEMLPATASSVTSNQLQLPVASNINGQETGNSLGQRPSRKQETKVIIKVLDRDGSEMGSFEASKHESILDTAEKHNIDIGYSCRSGACFSCACHSKQGFEHIDLGKFGYPLVDVDEGDCLTCIAGVMDDAWSGEDKEIIVKKF